MHCWIKRLIIIALMLGGIVATERFVNRDVIRAAAIERTRRELDATIIPRFELRKATLNEAVSYLRTEARTAGLRKDIQFRVLSEAEVRRDFRRRISPDTSMRIPGLEPIPGADGKSVPDAPGAGPNPITVSETSMSVDSAVRFISLHSDSEVRISPNSVEFARLPGDGTIGLYFRKAIAVRPGFVFQTDEDLRPNDPRDMRPFFESIGMVFYEGTSAEYDPRASTVTLRNTTEQLDFFDDLVRSEPASRNSVFDRIRDRIWRWFQPEPALPSRVSIPYTGSPPLPTDPEAEPDIPAIPGL